MKTNDSHVICEAVEVMIKLLTSLGVMDQNPAFIEGWATLAKRFAEDVMLDSSYDRIVQLTKMHSKAAQAFLIVLSDVRGQIVGEKALVASTLVGTPEMYHKAACAVERYTVAYANRRPL